MQRLLAEIVDAVRSDTARGTVATYIPELGRANPHHLGVYARLLDEDLAVGAGDWQVPFTLQSISKVLLLLLALMDSGPERVFTQVGMEPTGDPFNSIVKLETIHPGRPLNPMINAGAISITPLLAGEHRVERVLELARLLSGNPGLKVNQEVYRSEKATGHRNRAMAFFLKDLGLLPGDPETHLDVYFQCCSIEATCADIAAIAAVLAQDGRLPDGRQAVAREYCHIAKTFMVTCGMYNASGEFAIRVGIPAKSGVGGGIMALVPHRMGIGVFGPALDDRGNSVGGVRVLEELSRRLDLSIL